MNRGVACLLLLLANTAYLAGFPSTQLFYVGNVLLHVALGIALAAWAVWRFRTELRAATSVVAFAGIATAAGLMIAVVGNTRPHRLTLVAHTVASLAAVTALAVRVRSLRKVLLAAMAVCVAMAAAGNFGARPARILNPQVTPLSMQAEGAGAQSPFFPSSAQTADGNLIPSQFFLQSEACGECHKDAYQQWKGSMHHFASFNNPFYRKSIEYMQEAVGTQPSKWCAGCHDHAMLFSGKFDRPAAGQIETPEAQAGLGCVSCHAITQVAGTTGNGGFTIEYPALHSLALSKNRYIKATARLVTHLNPEPHRRAFLKPFMRLDSAEFCSSCHKVHLDAPVNSYRWIRGFNDYDNWQASAVSGQGARSFYYPASVSTCTDCHMTRVASNDPGSRDGMIHSHRFAAANTAVSTVNGDAEQLAATEGFLKSGFVSVDIFAVAPFAGDVGSKDKESSEVRLMSSTPTGEEAETQVGIVLRDVGVVSAPLGAVNASIAPGSVVRLDVVVRTRKVGHFFPGGTLDAFDVWLDVQARDSTGRIFFHSGALASDGAVDPTAHFYRSFQLDGEGNPIDKRNAWQTRSVLYARAIAPGAADTAHYRIEIPKDAKGPIVIDAKLLHRKFSHAYTRFVYGDRKPPALPVVTLATDTKRLALGPTVWATASKPEDRERWNDWGIGLLLQGDIRGAQLAFQKVTEAEPTYADGWLNRARALIQEGETGGATLALKKATELDPTLARVHYFRALVEKTDGEYDKALASLEAAAVQYPRDRVVLNQMARVLFLKRDFRKALGVLRRVAAVDPEDLQMHYTAMLCYRGLGRATEATQEQQLFERFKADEAAQALTQKRRQQRPEDNNERQPIHDHMNGLAP